MHSISISRTGAATARAGAQLDPSSTVHRVGRDNRLPGLLDSGHISSFFIRLRHYEIKGRPVIKGSHWKRRSSPCDCWHYDLCYIPGKAA